jgi:hypothetical protein
MKNKKKQQNNHKNKIIINKIKLWVYDFSYIWILNFLKINRFELIFINAGCWTWKNSFNN